MLDQLLNAAKSQIGDVLSKNDVSMDKADDIASLSGEAVKEERIESEVSVLQKKGWGRYFDEAKSVE